jgi:hypothetical protein
MCTQETKAAAWPIARWGYDGLWVLRQLDVGSLQRGNKGRDSRAALRKAHRRTWHTGSTTEAGMERGRAYQVGLRRKGWDTMSS